jgi:hypothetical protein
VAGPSDRLGRVAQPNDPDGGVWRYKPATRLPPAVPYEGDPIVSAILAPRAPIGFGDPSVVSGAV